MLLSVRQLKNILCVHFYFSIEENIDGQFGAQNCKLYRAHELVNQALLKAE